MNDDFDKRLLGDLSADDEAFLARLDDDRGLYEQMADTFTGPLKLWTAFAFVLSLAFFIGSIYALVQLWGGPPLRESLLWLALFSWLTLAVGLIKIWFWMRMNQIALLRELKKIELQVARLASTNG